MLTLGAIFLVLGCIVAVVAAFVGEPWHSRLIALILFCLCLGVLLLGVTIPEGQRLR